MVGVNVPERNYVTVFHSACGVGRGGGARARVRDSGRHKGEGLIAFLRRSHGALLWVMKAAYYGRYFDSRLHTWDNQSPANLINRR